MKKLFLLFSFFICVIQGKTQTDVFTSLKKVIHEHHPEMDLENKIIAFNIWSVNDSESREANKSFEKAVAVFGLARLKGGEKGIVAVSINRENLNSEATIIFGKDGNTKLISVKESDIVGLRRSSPKNAVYDSMGNEINKNLSSNQIFSAINSLITR